nr:unnamed protein product [Digitaria exilis]
MGEKDMENGDEKSVLASVAIAMAGTRESVVVEFANILPEYVYVFPRRHHQARRGSRSRHTQPCRSSTSRSRRTASSSPAVVGCSPRRLPATPACPSGERDPNPQGPNPTLSHVRQLRNPTAAASAHSCSFLDRAAAGDAAVSVAAEVCGLLFPPERASHHRELAAAVATVERACRLCVDVKRSLFSGGKSILEKNDQTPVTIADFGVQALVSLELQRLFPSIPLVAEEDSASLRSPEADDNNNVLVESIFSAVADKVSSSGSPLTQDDVLRAIDRGGKDAVSFDSNPATYWVLDPIDGTKGFLRGDDALYVLVQVSNGSFRERLCFCPSSTAGNSDQAAAAASRCLYGDCCCCSSGLGAASAANTPLEAGGQISDWSGKPLDLAADLTSCRIIYPSGGILVTNGVLHDKLVEMISANYK